MQKNLASELPELLARHQRCVWSDVVLMEFNSASVDQRWPLLHECCIQAVQLLAVQVRIERLAIELIVDDSLPILPNTQKNLPGHQSRLGYRLSSLTAFRSRPFALHVVVSDPFFIASIRAKMFFCVKSCGTHTSSFFLKPIFFKWLLADATAATTPVSFDQFSDFFAIFDDRPSGPWRIFDHLCTRTKTIVVRCKRKLYRLHKLHKFYWQHEMHFCLYRSSTVNYAVFSLYFAPCLRRYNSRTTKNKQQ